MSVNSRYRERKYNSSENDRLLRILSQPVQSWEKKWAPSTRSKSHHIHKWVKSDRTIVFEDEDDDEEDEEDKDQVMTEADKDTPLTTSHDNTQTTTQHDGNLAATAETGTKGDSASVNRGVDGTELFSTRSPPTNKQVTSTAMDEERTHTPKLSDVPDVDPDQIMADNDDDKESNTDDLNDPSRHPAYAPHIHPRLTDDDVLGTTPSQSEQTSTEATPKENDDFPMATNDSNLAGTMNNNNTIDNNVTTGPNESNTSNKIETTTTATTDQTLSTATVTETNSTVISTSPPPKPTPTTDAPEEGSTDHSSSPTTQSASLPTVTTSATTTTIENEPSLVSSPPPPQQQQEQEQEQQQQQTQQPPPPPVEQHKGPMDVDDRLLDAPVKTPDVVSATNTPGVDTPFDTATPSDMPMQRNINVVTENDTEMDITPTDPQANDEPAQ